MTSATFSIGPLKGRKELSALLDILAPTFNFTRAQGDAYSQIVGVKNYRVIRRRGKVVGGCALLPLGQFYGGKSVPMIGVAAVGIAPDQRGLGTASSLMKAAVLETHRRGIPISALYPATLPLYRSVGYEHAGYRFEIRIPAKTLIIKSRDEGMEMRPAGAKDGTIIRELYRRHARQSPGNLDRSEFIWHRVQTPRGAAASGFLVINSATKEAEGYTFYFQKESDMPHDLAHSPFNVHVTDHVALTAEAGRRLLEFYAHHRSMIDQIIFQGNPNDPILKLLPDRNYSARLLDHWMVRIVSVAKAMTARGYAKGLSAEVHLDISDDLIDANNGRCVLEVEDGSARVRSGGRGDVRIDIRGLAALYTGHLSPQELLIAGRLAPSSRLKNTEQVMAELASIFAGATPWLGDMF